jgi:hypothetical protein
MLSAQKNSIDSFPVILPGFLRFASQVLFMEQ